jgi:pilus assembly protein CpaB
MMPNLEIVDVPADLVVSGSFNSIDELSGIPREVSLVDMIPGEQLLRVRLGERPNISGVIIPPGLVEVTIALAPDRALGGLLAAGNRLGVLATFGSNPAEGVTYVLLHTALVTAVQYSNADAANVLSSGSPATGDVVRAPSSEILVTLAVSSIDANRVVFASHFGQLWLTAENAESAVGTEPPVDLPGLGVGG